MAAGRVAIERSLSVARAVASPKIRVSRQAARDSAITSTADAMQWSKSRPALDHYKLYMRLAAASARVQPARFPCASRRLARAKVAANVDCACRSARSTEAGVGWRSSCAPIDCGAIGPAFGFPADWRTAFSNCAILLVQGPACAGALLKPKAATTTQAAVARRAVVMACLPARRFDSPGYSNAKMRFQSFFMLITVQPSFFASS